MVVAMMFTMDIGIVGKGSGKKGFYCFICAAGNAAEKLDAGLHKHALRTAADAAADYGIYIVAAQETGQGAMAASCGVCYLFVHDLCSFNVVELELFRMSEMLKNVSVFVSYCNSHNVFSFL